MKSDAHNAGVGKRSKPSAWNRGKIGIVGVLWGVTGGGVLSVRVWNHFRAGQIPEKLTIGYAVEAPYAFVREDGQISGESPEIARLMAERLGVKQVTWRQVDFSALLQELRDGSIDVIAAGMFVTPERSRQAAFSTPTFRIRHGLMVRKGNPSRIRVHADLARSGLRVAVLAGSVEERYFRDVVGLRGRRILTVRDARAGVNALESNLVDALALSVPSLRWAAKLHPEHGLVVIVPEATGGVPAGAGEGAFAFRKSDERLLKAWNKELAKFLGSAEHVELVGRFGMGREEISEQALSNKRSK